MWLLNQVLPLKFQPLPLGEVKPLGWLKQQLDLMADGLPGHLHEFYRLVKDAPWLGGDQEYSCTSPYPTSSFQLKSSRRESVVALTGS